MINKYFTQKYENNSYDKKITVTKKAYKIFTDNVDSYMPILVFGIGSNKYPMQFLRDGFDIRVIEDNQDIVLSTREITNDDGYLYTNNRFDNYKDNLNENSYSGVWADNSFLFSSNSQIEKELFNLYYLLDDSGYIFLQRFITIKNERISDIDIEPNSKFKLEKSLSNINKRILAKLNEGIDPILHTKLSKIENYEIFKYEERVDIKTFNKAIKIANIIIRKK